MKQLYEAILANRRTGYTTAMVKVAVESKGVLVCRSEPDAKFLQRQNKGLDARSCHERLDDVTGPLLIDNGLLQVIVQENAGLVTERDQLSERCQVLEGQTNVLHRANVMLGGQIRGLQRVTVSQKLRLDSYGRRDANRKIRNGAGFTAFFCGK